MSGSDALVSIGAISGGIAGGAASAYLGIPPEIGVVAGSYAGGKLASMGVNKYNEHKSKGEGSTKHNKKRHKHRKS